MFRFYYNIIPRLQFKRISYIKKKKMDKAEEVEHLELIAKNKHISVRELKSYMEM